jgi:hypothetical protein
MARPSPFEHPVTSHTAFFAIMLRLLVISKRHVATRSSCDKMLFLAWITE